MDSLSKACAHQVCQNLALVPPIEGASAHLNVVNFNALLDVLSDILEERVFCLQLKEDGVDQVHAQDADGFLLEEVRAITHVDVENDLVRLAAGLQLEAQTYPTVRLICSSVVAGGDGIHEGKEAGGRPTAFFQLVEELGPFAIEHGFETFFGDVTCTGTVEIVTDFLVVRGDRFRNGPGGATYDQEPSHDLLASTNLGKGAVAGCIEVDVERLLMDVKILRRCHRTSSR